MYIEYDDIDNPLQYCIDVILKEAKEEGRLVRQILLTMLSAATNNPINLAINSPTGEGKTWVIQKVGEMFPKEDVMYLAGMTEKALFHRAGELVVENELGEYESLEIKIANKDSEIWEKQQEILRTKNEILKDALTQSIEDIENDKKELQKRAKKLIDLSHKVLVFLDSPSVGLFSALMPLLSHDRYDVEYEFVDTHNGIKTRTNILRGWPAVIFAQAIDYSHYVRFPEIQRRFIVTNPKMDAIKYSAAIDLMGHKYGLPDFVYQVKIISDSERQRVQTVIDGMKQRIPEVCSGVYPGKNNVFIPFSEILTKSLPREKAFDMTVANRFFTYLSLLPLINSDKRPRLFIRTKAHPFTQTQTVPLASFDDLKDTMFLMQYANGVRPYVLQWYYDVFLVAYNEKTVADSRTVVRGKEEVYLSERRIAVTSQDLVEKTKEISKKTHTKKNITEHYVNPLINQGYIDSIESELDHRSNIYYPLINSEKNRKLGKCDSCAYLLDENSKILTDSSMFPDKDYLISRIREVLEYSAETVEIKVLDKLGHEISIEALVDQYYSNPCDYFDFKEQEQQISSVVRYYPSLIAKKNFSYPTSADYFQNDGITRESQENHGNLKDLGSSDSEPSL
jgi:hypothetical protein